MIENDCINFVYVIRLGDYYLKERVGDEAYPLCLTNHLTKNIAEAYAFEEMSRAKWELEDLFEHHYLARIDPTLKAEIVPMKIVNWKKLYEQEVMKC